MTSIPGKFSVILALGVLSFTSLNNKQLSPADVEITLPAGFKAETVVKMLGRNRHLVVNSNGDIYLKLDKLKDGNGIIVLRNYNGDYKTIKSFGNYTGTGIAVKKGYLYASSDNEVFRYRFNANNEITNPDSPEKIVAGIG